MATKTRRPFYFISMFFMESRLAPETEPVAARATALLARTAGLQARLHVTARLPVDRVLGDPLHPYTRLLKESVPRANPDKAWDTNAKLSAPSVPKRPFTGGCKFAARCPAVMDRCRHEVPPSFDADGRSVKCFLYEA